MEHVQLPDIAVAYERHGTRDADTPLILLHGFPDDATAWNGVGQRLSAEGHACIAPYVRGCGPTRFTSADAPRSGQVAARARDLLGLMDALGIDRAVLIGQDWGAATAQAVAMLHPKRVERLVVLNGHGLLNMAVFAQGQRPSWPTLHAGWYQWMFSTPIAEPLLRADRRGLARYLWQQWSPGWRFDESEFVRVARSLDNEDWPAVVLSAYRPWNADPSADPQDAADSERLATGMTIGCPTLNLQGADDGVDLFEDTQLGQEAFYRGGFERAVLKGCGHFLHRERPEAVAERILEFIGQSSR